MPGGEVFQATEDLEPERLIEWQRLEVERVAVRMPAAALHSFVLSCFEEPASKPGASSIFPHPEVADEKPVPMREAEQAADERVVVARQHM